MKVVLLVGLFVPCESESLYAALIALQQVRIFVWPAQAVSKAVVDPDLQIRWGRWRAFIQTLR